MYDIAEQVRDWLATGHEVTIAQVVATRGFSSRDPAAAAAWAPGADPVGSVLDGIEPASLAGRPTGLTEVVISDAEAVGAGLACGGAASVLISSASTLPADVWQRLTEREPVCIVTEPDGSAAVFDPRTIRSVSDRHDQVPRLFGRGVSTTALLDDGAAVVALWPVPTLVVVGEGLIAEALVAAGELLGWTSRVTPTVDDAIDAIGALHRSDAAVVLSHSREVDGPTLAAALAGDAGYVGALGSRRTQAARREWLTERGVGEDDQRRIHGPAGLDIGAHTPGEIAVSIVAEILAGRGESSGGALRDRSGPVHTDGVNAPPPRH